MLRYAQVEDALMRIQSVPESYRIAMRARIKNLQRLGVKKDAPGKGTRLSYDFEDVALWSVCLELAQFNIDPIRIALMSKWLWLSVSPALLREHDGGDLFFVARPVFLSREAIEHDEQSGKTGQGLFPADASDPHARMIFTAEALCKRLPTRSVIVNLSDLRRRIVEAIDAVA